jgi:hypothetical protein
MPRGESRIRPVWKGGDQIGSKKFRALKSRDFVDYPPRINLSEPSPRGRGRGPPRSGGRVRGY